MHTTPNNTRRQFINTLWITPIITTTTLPTHAQTSTTTPHPIDPPLPNGPAPLQRDIGHVHACAIGNTYVSGYQHTITYINTSPNNLTITAINATANSGSSTLVTPNTFPHTIPPNGTLTLTIEATSAGIGCFFGGPTTITFIGYDPLILPNF